MPNHPIRICNSDAATLPEGVDYQNVEGEVSNQELRASETSVRKEGDCHSGRAWNGEKGRCTVEKAYRIAAMTLYLGFINGGDFPGILFGESRRKWTLAT